MRIALAGNPNCGKTTLFNALTGSNQYVGNWPGVTVEKKGGKLKSDKSVEIEDLPGIYSLSPYTLEEVVSRNFLVNEKPDAIINIIDGTNIERNLYLTTQILELGIPTIVAVNMMDLVEKNKGKINIEKLSEKLGVDVVSISALKGTGIDALVKKATALAKSKKAAPIAHHFNEAVEDAIAEVEEQIGDLPESRFLAIKVLEKDNRLQEIYSKKVDADSVIKSLEEKFDDDTESIITNERYEFITSIIDKVAKTSKAGSKLTVSDKIDKIVTNRILALPIFALIMFIVYYLTVSTIGSAMTDFTNDCIFGDGFHLFGMSEGYDDAKDEWAEQYVFTDEVKQVLEDAAADSEVIGADKMLEAFEEADYDGFSEAYNSYASDLMESENHKSYDIEGALTASGAMEDGEFTAPDPAEYGTWIPGVPVLVGNFLDKINCADWLKSLILEGIVKGVGAVLGFVPQMLVLFILLAILEECGYMARIAFIMDRVFRRFGLSGKAFIPILIGTGCGVPGIMASRTIENERDRRMTIITTTFIPCGAKLPIIALIASALFGGSGFLAWGCFFIGIAAIITSGIILKKTKMFSGDPAPFVMELPAYHMPTAGAVFRSMWERGWSFIKRAGTVILLASIVIWAGTVFGNDGTGFGYHPDLELGDSVLGMIGNAIKWIFIPLGFGTGETGIKATVATFMGLVAKEEVVGVFGVLDFEGLTKLTGFSFLVFNLLSAPCFAAIGAIKREMNSPKWTFFAIGYQCLLAYLASLVIFQIGRLVTSGVFTIGTVAAFVVVILFIYLLFRPYKESETLDIKIAARKTA